MPRSEPLGIPEDTDLAGLRYLVDIAQRDLLSSEAFEKMVDTAMDAEAKRPCSYKAAVVRVAHSTWEDTAEEAYDPPKRTAEAEAGS